MECSTPSDTYLGGDVERVGELHLLKAVATATATLSCLGSAFLIVTIHLMQAQPRHEPGLSARPSSSLTRSLAGTPARSAHRLLALSGRPRGLAHLCH